MISKILGFAAAASMIASPAFAAGQDAPVFFLDGSGSSVAANVYFRIPVGGSSSGRPQSGLRFQLDRGHRLASEPVSATSRPEILDLRLEHGIGTTFYVGGLPLAGKYAAPLNFTDGETVATAALVVAGLVGGIFLFKTLDRDREDEDRCLLPEGCP
ncbi:MAG TPA: hypothetical protein VM346_05460 [Sphingomicrobium sp.]|nr:hypothetical protein [Sphingomicrobium sp.]